MNINFQQNFYNQPLKLTNQNKGADYNHVTNTSNQSFKGIEEAAQTFANKLVQNKKIQNLLVKPKFNGLLKAAVENPNLYEALVALMITWTARPLTIIATPGAKMEDKEYASAQSMASGLSGLVFQYAIFETITQAVEKTLISVNGKNIQKVFENFYNNKNNEGIIKKLSDMKIIPPAEKFSEELAKGNKTDIYKFMKDFLKKHGKKVIDTLIEKNNPQEIKKWNELAKQYSDILSNEYKTLKGTGITDTQKYLVHESFDFIKEGAYKLKQSLGAARVQFSTNLIAKMAFFPLTALATIWAIPKIMRVVFPNHRKSKAKNNTVNHTKAQTMPIKNHSENLKSLQNKNVQLFNKFQNKPAMNLQSSQVSFSGGFSGLKTIYEKGYKEPIGNLIAKGFKKIVFSKYYSNKIQDYNSVAQTTKYGLTSLVRDKSGKCVSKWDDKFLTSNFPNIVAIFGSCLYIFNTIRNKEIEPERKPALCTNMALVAALSLFASGGLEKLSKPIFEELERKHTSLMRNKLNYDNSAAWKSAKKLLTSTIAFRYIGPVLATPAADKLLKLFKNPNVVHEK